ncbi:MAG: hypothetical protein J6M38_01290 [Lentisphaeria bacterium]|nr:hypothetical protein [Lentisphaeria bacterium]
MEKNSKYEIERKYLIAYPDGEKLMALPGARVCDIVQTYLCPDEGERRVRRWCEDGKETFYYTRKQKAGELRRLEEEQEISEEAYESLLREADPRYHPLKKRRYTIPYGNHRAEIDVYPFFRDRAILEVELSDENEEFDLPDFVSVIREVTGEKEYKNPVLAAKYGD